MRDDHGLYHRLRAILFVLVIEWTSAQCVPRTTQWRLVISQEYNSWDAYVYEIKPFEGTQVLDLTYSVTTAPGRGTRQVTRDHARSTTAR